MQTNDFEKKIQQQLEKFTLPPNDDIWLKVEGRIKKEKKRRRILFFWFFAGLLLVAAGGLRWYNMGSVSHNYSSNKPTETNAKGSEERESLTYKQIGNGRHTTEGQHEKKSPGLSNYVKQSAKSSYTKKASGEYSRTKVKPVLRQSSFVKGSKALISGNKGTLNNTADKLGRDLYAAGKLKDARVQRGDKHPEPANVPQMRSLPTDTEGPASAELNKKDGITNASDARNITAVEKISPDTQAIVTVPNKNSRKINWTFGLSLLGGISDNIHGLALFPTTKSLDAYSIPSNGATSSLSTSGQALVYKSTLSFGAGLFAKRRIGTRLTLQAGINYHFYSVNLNVGQKVDSVRVFNDMMLNNTVAVGSFYRTGQSLSESSKYHLIEVPVIVGLVLNKNENHPVSIDLGVSPGYLIGSNALYYNRTTRTFYEERDQFRSFQLQVNGGFMYGLLDFHKYTVGVGPLFKYGLTNLTKAAAKTDEHLFFAGLKANITLKR